MKKPILIGLVGIAAIAAFGVIWFQPQKLVIDETVNETPAPTVALRETSTRSGTFTSLEHETTGTATISGHTLRLEGFETSNGPDVRVWLSAGEPYAEDHVDLGALKGNIGDQNYEIPADVDVEAYDTVVIWCRRFTVPFGAARIAQA